MPGVPTLHPTIAAIIFLFQWPIGMFRITTFHSLNEFFTLLPLKCRAYSRLSTVQNAGHTGWALREMQGIQAEHYAKCRAYRLSTVQNAGHTGWALCEMQGIQQAEHCAKCRAYRLSTSFMKSMPGLADWMLKWVTKTHRISVGKTHRVLKWV